MAPEIFAGQAYNGLKADMFSAGVLLFILLTGVPPFYKPSSKDASFRIVMKGRLGLESLIKAWSLVPRVPPEAIDLLSKLLCPAESRYSVSEALNHPFLSQFYHTKSPFTVEQKVSSRRTMSANDADAEYPMSVTTQNPV